MTYYSTQNIESALTQGTLKGSAETPLVLVRAEAENIDTPNSTIEHVIFERFASSYLKLNDSSVSHTEFRDCVIHKLFLKRSHVNNVVFKNCKIKSLNIQGANLQGVVFEKSQVDAVSFLLSEGDVAIIDSDFHDARLNESIISWTITNSTLNKIEAFKIGGSITLKDSTFTDANLEFGEMDSFEAYNSTIDALGPTTIRNQLVIKGGKVEWSGMNAGSVHVDGISAQRFSMSYGDMGNVVIENCRKLGVLGFSQSKVDTLHVRNCKIDDFGGHATITNRLQLEDVSIHDLVLAESDIQRWKMNNVKLTGKLNFELGTIREKQFTNVDVDRKAVINLRNTTFSFP